MSCRHSFYYHILESLLTQAPIESVTSRAQSQAEYSLKLADESGKDPMSPPPGRRKSISWPSLKIFYKEVTVAECTSRIPNSSQDHFLKLYLELDSQLPERRILMSEPIEVSIQHAWETRLFWPHMTFLVCYIFGYLVVLGVSNYTVADGRIHGAAKAILTLLSAVLLISRFLTISFCTYQNYKDREQSNTDQSDKVKAMLAIYDSSDPYLAAELLSYTLIIAGCWEPDPETSAVISSLGTMLAYVKCVALARPFKNFGTLVGVIEAVYWRVKEFTVLLALIVFGFSQALYLLSYRDPDQDDSFDLRHPESSLLRTFQYLGGGFVVPQRHTNPSWVDFIVCVFFFTVSIVLLNLLIAIINNAYSDVVAEAKVVRLRKLTQAILQSSPFGRFAESLKNACATYCRQLRDRFRRRHTAGSPGQIDVTNAVASKHVKYFKPIILKKSAEASSTKTTSEVLREYVYDGSGKVDAIHKLKNDLSKVLENTTGLSVHQPSASRPVSQSIRSNSTPQSVSRNILQAFDAVAPSPTTTPRDLSNKSVQAISILVAADEDEDEKKS